jgi:hypothetical protein
MGVYAPARQCWEGRNENGTVATLAHTEQSPQTEATLGLGRVLVGCFSITYRGRVAGASAVGARSVWMFDDPSCLLAGFTIMT